MILLYDQENYCFIQNPTHEAPSYKVWFFAQPLYQQLQASKSSKDYQGDSKSAQEPWVQEYLEWELRLSELSKLLPKLSQAILICWLWQFTHPPLFPAPFSFPTDPMKRRKPFCYEKFAWEIIQLNRKEFVNPCINSSFSMEVPKGAKIVPTEGGFSLRDTQMKICLSSFGVFHTSFPSALMNEAIGFPGLESLKALKEFKGLEYQIAVEFDATIERMGRDSNLELISEMVENLEEFLDWYKYIRTSREEAIASVARQALNKTERPK